MLSTQVRVHRLFSKGKRRFCPSLESACTRMDEVCYTVWLSIRFVHAIWLAQVSTAVAMHVQFADAYTRYKCMYIWVILFVTSHYTRRAIEFTCLCQVLRVTQYFSFFLSLSFTLSLPLFHSEQSYSWTVLLSFKRPDLHWMNHEYLLQDRTLSIIRVFFTLVSLCLSITLISGFARTWRPNQIKEQVKQTN